MYVVFHTIKFQQNYGISKSVHNFHTVITVTVVTPSSDSLTLLGVSGTVPPASSNGIGGGGILLREGAREGAAGVGGVDGCGGGVRC